MEIPRGGLPHEILSNTALQNMTVVGDLLWLVAYLLIIRAGFRQRSYGLPLVAVALNFTWEVYFTFIQPPTCAGGSVDHVKFGLFLAWLVFDAVIVYQLIRFGKAEQGIPEIRKGFYPVVAATFALALFGHLTFHRFFHDEGGKLDAYIINLIMSVLFVFLYFGRRDLRGLSYGAAWSKLLGTGIISFANVFWLWEGTTYAGFYLFLFLSVLGFDSLYVILLHRARIAARATPLPQG